MSKPNIEIPGRGATDVGVYDLIFLIRLDFGTCDLFFLVLEAIPDIRFVVAN